MKDITKQTRKRAKHHNLQFQEMMIKPSKFLIKKLQLLINLFLVKSNEF